MDPRYFGYHVTVVLASVLASVRTYLCIYVRLPPTNKPMSNVTFTLARLTELLEREKKNNKADFFCPLNFDVYTETYNREKATARDKKQKKGIFDGRTTWHFCSCGKKLRNASGSEKEKKRSGTQATNCFVIKYGISSITRAIRKFYVLDPVHTINSFSLSSKTHPSICVHTTVLIRLRPSTQKRSKTVYVESHVVT